MRYQTVLQKGGDPVFRVAASTRPTTTRSLRSLPENRASDDHGPIRLPFFSHSLLLFTSGHPVHGRHVLIELVLYLFEVLLHLLGHVVHLLAHVIEELLGALEESAHVEHQPNTPFRPLSTSCWIVMVRISFSGISATTL